MTKQAEGQSQSVKSGALLLGLSTYVLWGLFPLYFYYLDPAGSLEVIVHRAFWGLVSCIVAITIMSRWQKLQDLLQDRQAVARLAVAGVLVLVNWAAYIYAVQTGRTVDAALGYFINPLVTVLLARLVLKERLRPAQLVAIGLGVVAVIIMAIGVGSLPWISLVLALPRRSPSSSVSLYSMNKWNPPDGSRPAWCGLR